MLVVADSGDIRLSKGDDATLIVNIEGGTIAAGDSIYFAVKAMVGSDSKLIDIGPVNPAADATSFNIVFAAADTQDIPYGTYCYDLMRVTADGKVTHIIWPGKFILEAVVADGQ